MKETKKSSVVPQLGVWVTAWELQLKHDDTLTEKERAILREKLVNSIKKTFAKAYMQLTARQNNEYRHLTDFSKITKQERQWWKEYWELQYVIETCKEKLQIIANY